MGYLLSRSGTRGSVSTGFGVALCALWPLAGCSAFAAGSDVLTAEQNSATPANTTGSDDATMNDWSCLNGVVGVNDSNVTPDRNQRATYSVFLIDGVTSAPPVGMQVRACNNFDPECQLPVISGALAGADGVVHLELFRGFNGFLEITSPVTVPNLYFLPEPLVGDVVGPTYALAEPAGLQGLAALNGLELDPARGHVFGVLEDCAGRRASGVKLSNDKGGIGFFFVGGTPTVTQPYSAADGTGGFVNLLPGAVVVRAATLDNRPISAKTMYVRPGWFSDTTFAP